MWVMDAIRNPLNKVEWAIYRGSCLSHHRHMSYVFQHGSLTSAVRRVPSPHLPSTADATRRRVQTKHQTRQPVVELRTKCGRSARTRRRVTSAGHSQILVPALINSSVSSTHVVCTPWCDQQRNGLCVALRNNISIGTTLLRIRYTIMSR